MAANGRNVTVAALNTRRATAVKLRLVGPTLSVGVLDDEVLPPIGRMNRSVRSPLPVPPGGVPSRRSRMSVVHRMYRPSHDQCGCG